MKLNEGCKKMLDTVLNSDDWESSLVDVDCVVNDDNFNSVQAEVRDSILGILSNAAISILEQKKLLQSAKTPSALQSALKLLAVTGGNLLHAGVSVLNWAGNSLSVHDSAGVRVLLQDSNYALLRHSNLGDYSIVTNLDEATNTFVPVVRGIRSEKIAIEMFKGIVGKNSDK